jgi:hypothetical protein
MSCIALVAALLVGSVEVGGQVAGVYPIAGLDRYHASSALVGAGVAYAKGPVRVELGYRYSGLPGVQNSSYRLSFHQAALEAGYGFLRRHDWGLEAIAGAGYVFAQRVYGTGRENGKAGSGQIGFGFFQYAGKSRLSVALLHTLFLEKGRAGSPGIAVGQLLSLRAGVAYVF